MAIKKLYFHFSHQRPRGGSTALRGSPCPRLFPSPRSSPSRPRLSSARPSVPPAGAAPASPPARPGISIHTRSGPPSRPRTASVPTCPGLTWTASPRWAALPPGAARRDSRSSSSSPWRENWRPLRPPRPPARDAEGGAHGAAAAVSPAPGGLRHRKRPCSPSLHRARALLGVGPGLCKAARRSGRPVRRSPILAPSVSDQENFQKRKDTRCEGLGAVNSRKMKGTVGSLWDESVRSDFRGQKYLG